MASKKIILFLFTVYPIAILVGNSAINASIILISLFYLYILLRKIDVIFINDKLFLLLIFFLCSLIINLFFSNNFNLSFPRILKIFFIIFFILSFRFLLSNLSKSQIEKLYSIWSLIFLIVIVDLLIEFFSGKNILGLISTMPGQRLASFTGGDNIHNSESVIGYYFYGFVLIFLSVFKKYFKNQILNILIAYSLIALSFLIGERANFIKVFLVVNIYIFLMFEINYKIKISFFVILISLLVIFLKMNPTYKVRYYDQIKTIFINDGIFNYTNNSQYGAHYNVAKEIFFNNPILGVGIKNFRIESASKKYENLDHPKNHLRIATHPHQVHYEFLSETGIFGYFSFLIFIFFSLLYSLKKYLNEKNSFQLAGILFVLSSVLPILPTGSFLSTYSSSIFWINYSIMMGYVSLKNNVKY